MKATEILSMIEEAAGTRMFEDRRDKAFKTMSKKDKKVDEINDLLKEEIEPKLDKLRTEKRAFLAFQQTQSDLERLTKLVVAHDFIKNRDRVARSAEDLEMKKQQVRDLEESAIRLQREIDTIAEEVKSVKAQRDKELRKGGKFQELEDSVKEKSHEIVRLDAILELKTAGLAEETEKRKQAQKQVKDLERQLSERTQTYENLKAEYDDARANFDALDAEFKKKEELLQTLQTGVASKEGQESGYQNQLQGKFGLSGAAETVC